MIIPSINRAAFGEAEKDVRQAEEFVPAGGWLHLDVADGKFTPWKSWNNPGELGDLKTQLNIEVHLMVDDPVRVSVAWLEAGARRLIVPVQAVLDMDALRSVVQQYGAELVPSFDSSVSIEDAKKYEWADCIGVLAVSPGESGQVAGEWSFDAVKFLREAMPDAKIEFDGGVDINTGMRALDAGADILVSGHYIFENVDPKESFTKLNSLKPNVS